MSVPAQTHGLFSWLFIVAKKRFKIIKKKTTDVSSYTAVQPIAHLWRGNVSFHYSHFTQTISHFRDDQQIQEPVWKQCDLLGPVWCVQPAEAGPPHSLHIKSLYCSDCPPFFGNSSGAAPPEGGEVWLDASFIALSCFTGSPDAPRPSDTVISWMHPKPERGKLFLFIPLNSFFFFLRFYYKQPSFHGWTSLVQTVVLCLVQILFACQDAVPHLPWRKCCGRAEKKESFEALCKLYTLSLFCSCSSRSPVQLLCIVSVEI